MTTREFNAWEKAKAKAIRTAKADLKKSDGWRLGQFSKMYAYELSDDFKLEQKRGDWLIKKFVFLCESHHGMYEVWTWTVEVDIDLRKKAVIIERNIKEL